MDTITQAGQTTNTSCPMYLIKDGFDKEKAKCKKKDNSWIEVGSMNYQRQMISFCFSHLFFSIKVDKTVLFESQVREKRQRERKKGGDVHVDI